MEKQRFRGDESWKKKEPRFNFNEKQKIQQRKSQMEQAAMESQLHQEVAIIFEKKKLWNMERTHSFIVSLKIPLTRKEIMEKMRNAFPKLTLIEDGFE